MDTFLTPRQQEILKLRHEGKTQKEVARRLGTTRENISIAEKRARENVRKARKTLEDYERWAAIKIDMSPITDIVKIPKAVFNEADSHSIKVAHSATDILERVEAYINAHGRSPDKVLLLQSGVVELE